MSAHTPGPWHMAEDGTIRQAPAKGMKYAEPVIYASAWRDGAWAGDDATPTSLANGRLMAAAPELLAACVNARDMLSTDRQAFVDCHRLRDARTDDPIAHGLVWADEETWIESDAAAPLRDYDKAIELIDAAISKAEGAQS